jgi:prepilin signal peptidase PulO-like enzyme (type II secretory pathway)
MIIAVLVSALIFAIASAIGIPIAAYLTKNLERFDDGPPIMRIPQYLPIVCAAILGAVYGFNLAHVETPAKTISEVLLFAPAVMVAIACLFVDAKTGLVPDILTVPALLVVLVYALFTGNNLPFAGAAMLFLPFAMTAYFSKGLGMGWGDVKLVAFAGAVLGPSRGLVAAVLACLATYVIAKIQKKSKEPVAFAPALVASFAVILGVFS